MALDPTINKDLIIFFLLTQEWNVQGIFGWLFASSLPSPHPLHLLILLLNPLISEGFFILAQ